MTMQEQAPRKRNGLRVVIGCLELEVVAMGCTQNKIFCMFFSIYLYISKLQIKKYRNWGIFIQAEVIGETIPKQTLIIQDKNIYSIPGLPFGTSRAHVRKETFPYFPERVNFNSNALIQKTIFVFLYIQSCIIVINTFFVSSQAI